MATENSINSRLIEQYAEAVSIASLGEMAAKSPNLAGLFVAGVNENYLNSPRKIMIVGKETKTWANGLKQVGDFPSSTAYFKHMVECHAGELRDPQRKSKFFQFYRHASMRIADAPVWANLFCLSHDRGSPVACAGVFEEIEQLSRTLLRIQVEVLQPDVILFVTGHRYDRYLKRCFDIRDGRVHTPRALWSFKADGIQAYRTSHPQWERGREFRERALAFAMMAPGDRMELVDGKERHRD